MTYHEYLASFSLWLWTEMANHLWQSTLFLLLALAIVAILRKAAAKSRYTVWLIASAKFVLPLAAFAALGKWLNLGSFLPSAATLESPVSSGGSLINIVSSEPVTTQLVSTIEITYQHNEIYCILTLLWLLGCLSLLALWRKRSRAFKAALGFRHTPTTEREAELLNNAQVRIGLTATRVNLIVSDSILEPVVLGIWKPTVVMPRGLSQKLTDDEFESVLMHELSHVARRDNLVGILQMALCCLLWFHPLVWLVKRKLLEERERACDEAVIMHENKPQIYASGLLKVVQYGLHSHQSAGVANAASTNLNKRVELIMENKIKNTNAKWQKLVVGSTAASLILICIVAVFALARTNSAASSESPDQSPVVSEPTAKLYEVEVYAGGKLYTTMKLNIPKPGAYVFQYSLYQLSEEQKAQTAEGKQIYAFQLIPTIPEEDVVAVEILALLEDVNTVSNSHPLHEFKKQTVASYSVRNGESAVVSEMSQLGVKPFEIKVTKVTATQIESRKMDNALRTVTIRKGDELPDVLYKIVGNDDSPLKITEATGRVVTNALYTKLTGQTTVTTGADGKTVFPNVYSAPVVKMVNNSGKTINGLVVVVKDSRPNGRGKSYMILQGKPGAPRPISILPGESYTVNFRENHPMFSEKYWLAEYTDPSDFYVMVAQIQFDDGTSWTAKQSE